MSEKVIKTHSSKWTKSKESQFSKFYWQYGYDISSVNPKEFDNVADHIKNQKAQHQSKSFQPFRGEALQRVCLDLRPERAKEPT